MPAHPTSLRPYSRSINVNTGTPAMLISIRHNVITPRTPATPPTAATQNHTHTQSWATPTPKYGRYISHWSPSGGDATPPPPTPTISGYHRHQHLDAPYYQNMYHHYNHSHPSLHILHPASPIPKSQHNTHYNLTLPASPDPLTRIQARYSHLNDTYLIHQYTQLTPLY